MTDLERIELACRRIADCERMITGIRAEAVIRVFELLATELCDMQMEVDAGRDHSLELERFRK